MNRIQATHAITGAPGESADLKIKKAGAQFEAILLNNLLGGLERAFTDLPGKKADNSARAYSGLAMQALSSGLAEHGGIGIGRLIAQALSKHEAGTTVKIKPPNLLKFSNLPPIT